MAQINFLRFLLLLLLLQRLLPLKADIIKTTVTADSRPSMHFKDFCFSDTGFVSIFVSDLITPQIFTRNKSLNSSNTGFYLIEYNGKRPSKADYVCPTESPHLKPKAFTSQTCVAPFNQLSLFPPFRILNMTIKVSHKGIYGVYFSNCEKKQVSMNVEIQTYGVDQDKQRSYLPFETVNIRFILDFYSQFYFEIILLWVLICCVNIKQFQRIHWLISMLFVIKYLSQALSIENKRYGSLMGTPHLWDFIFYALHSSQVVFMGVVLMLIAFGWPLRSPIYEEKN